MPVRTCPTPSWARLSGWPDAIADEDGHLFALTGDDLAWLAGFNRDDKRLGEALQLCALPWLGWIPDEIMKTTTFAPLLSAHRRKSLGSWGDWDGRCDRVWG